MTNAAITTMFYWYELFNNKKPRYYYRRGIIKDAVGFDFTLMDTIFYVDG